MFLFFRHLLPKCVSQGRTYNFSSDLGYHNRVDTILFGGKIGNTIVDHLESTKHHQRCCIEVNFLKNVFFVTQMVFFCPRSQNPNGIVFICPLLIWTHRLTYDNIYYLEAKVCGETKFCEGLETAKFRRWTEDDQNSTQGSICKSMTE